MYIRLFMENKVQEQNSLRAILYQRGSLQLLDQVTVEFSGTLFFFCFIKNCNSWNTVMADCVILKNYWD